MDSLFTIPLNSILIAFLVMLAGIAAVVLWIGMRHPLFVRMGLRNIVRRRAQTTLIIFGLMLSTLIISAAFATGDTVGYSVTNQIYDDLEHADIVITFDPDVTVERDDRYLTEEFLGTFDTAFRGDPDVDGISGATIGQLPVVNNTARLSEPEASFVGVDAATIDTFEGLKSADGKLLSAAALVGNVAYITEDLAENVDARAGDTVTVFFENRPFEFRVLDVLEDTSVTGAAAGPESSAGGIVVARDVAQELMGLDGQISLIAVSLRGGVRDTLDLSDGVEDRIDEFLLEHPEGNAEVLFTKKEQIALGEAIGSIFVSIFLIFGLFAIAAGVLLVFLIFVMLAAERRSEMGMARAIGMRRQHLVETFLAEGIGYDVGAAAVGALFGLGAAFLLVWWLDRIVSEFGFNIAFHFNWRGFVIAYALGVVLTFVTVTFSAFRVVSLNIVRAIRDLPEPQPLRGNHPSLPQLLKATVGAVWMIAWIVVIAVVVGGAFNVAALSITGLAEDLPDLVAGVLAVVVFAIVAAAMLGILGQTRRWVHRLRTTNRKRRAAGLVLHLVLSAVVSGGTSGAAADAPELLAAILSAVSLAALGSFLFTILLLSRKWAARHRNAGGWAVLMILGGILLIWLSGWGAEGGFLGWWQGKAFAYTGGVTLGVLAIAMLAVYFGAASRPAFTVAGLALVWYWLLPLPFSFFSDSTQETFDPIDGIVRIVGLPRPHDIEGNIEMFFVSGIAMNAAAVLVIIFNAELALAPVRWAGRVLGGIGPAVKTAVAYPLAAKFRTGMTLAMFGLVVFSLVVMATLNFNFTQVFLGEDAAAGYDVAVTVNPNNRIPDLREALVAEGYDPDEEIAGIGRLVSAATQARISGADFEGYTVAGADDEFIDLQRMPLAHRAIGYESDEAVWEAIRTDPTVAIVDASRLEVDNPFDDGSGSDFTIGVDADTLREAPWQPIEVTLRDPGTGEERQLQVIGVLEPQVTSVLFSFAAIITNIENLETTFDGGEVESYYLVTRNGSDEAALDVARAVESTLLDRGIQAESIHETIEEQAALSTGFQLLFEWFMGLGLVVGIAALGVIAFRTVVERRQQIGMLRAIGYRRRLVMLSYFMESSFIALAGIGIGIGLGLPLSYNLLTSPEFTDGAEVAFQVPWVRLVTIVGVAYVVSALMTLAPAIAASRVPVAEALRYE